jgi:hypothetical protein
MNKLTSYLLCAALSGCGTPMALPDATGATKSDESKVIVIGKFELVPPIDINLEQDNEKTKGPFVSDTSLIANRILMATGGKPNSNILEFGNWNDSDSIIDARWGSLFFVHAPRQRTYLNGGKMLLDMGGRDTLLFPGGFYFDVPEGAEVIYIGTLRYTRNDFNSITRIEVIDDRGKLKSQLPKKYRDADIRPSLLKSAREAARSR